ncbi:hypothetical protein HMPREF1981_00818 [Bacteroides pyogenes F0041]|uniref:Uncharacterized protein n=1 Tax=Bacteroides pyogenes F0041 TaxID=1321819 RepID=U2DY14_9BACE|nr:hypothetical protein HMPREF1981_00818 [Bacteroides pyogenes F0041]
MKTIIAKILELKSCIEPILYVFCSNWNKNARFLRFLLLFLHRVRKRRTSYKEFIQKR